MRETTEIRLDEHGDETHESWLLVGANRVQHGPTGRWLFDSEIGHHHYIQVRVTRCARRRDLNHDWHHGTEVILEMEMSQAQWGAFVSSFGQGSGVPATLTWLDGPVPQAPGESRFDESHGEVLESGEKALAEIKAAFDRLAETFESGGKRAQREALRDLGCKLQNAPKNMEFAARSLTEHVENVVTKARADIEGMALAAAQRGELAGASTPLLGSGDADA